MTKLEAVNELVKYDHCFMTVDGARTLAEPFGYDVEKIAYIAKDTRSEFKGLTMEGKQEGDEALGVDADRLAEALCQHLELEYRPMMGRGFRLRHCCQVIRESLENEGN